MERKKRREHEQGISAKSPHLKGGNALQRHTAKTGLQVAMKRVKPVNKVQKRPITVIPLAPKAVKVDAPKEYERSWRVCNSFSILYPSGSLI
jgi:hypothetical protein